MYNPEAKLSEKFTSGTPDMVPIRHGYGEGLIEAGDKDRNVVVLTGDLAESTRSEAFAKKYPDRFFEAGVAEQNMATIAAGLGISGKIPFISSYAVFSPGRNWEQIRTTITYNNSNVKIAGHHAGVSTGPDGATHQAIEDIATMRVLANMRVFVPCDAIEAKKATLAAASIAGPVYLRFARNPSAVMTTDETPFTPGKAEVFYDSSLKPGKKAKKATLLIAACGPLVHDALQAAAELEKKGIASVVLNVHTVKPLDEKKIVELAKKSDAVITVEEHTVLGGLGGAIAEVLARRHPKRMAFVGMWDVYGESGLPEELRHKYGLDKEAIINTAIELVDSL